MKPYLFMGVLFLLSSAPGQPSSGGAWIPHLDKILHAVLYAGLVRSFRPHPRALRLPVEWLPRAVAASGTFAILDELHQAWVPGRTAAWEDLLADAVGITSAALVLGADWSRPRR